MKANWTLTAAAALLIGISGAALAQDASPEGVWLRDSGETKVRIAKCGDAMCGTVAWVKDGAKTASKVGMKVFFDMKPAGGGKWKGSAFNPEDGKTYSGTMTLSGGSLSAGGCVLGGLICKSVNYTRSN
ncbi:MAG: DUF2147 domain-containing protein [Hyphomicrobiaceae bacterium]|nr:DUF2147 domain-containing protein [Hyphomicrobiaceae bacterium]